MAKTSTTFKPGKSGNPKGRPPKNRALTELLKTAGNKKVEHGGELVANKKLLADLVWQLATTGAVVLPGTTTAVAVADATEWLAVAKFIYTHIDGPAKQEVDVTSGGAPLQFNISGVIEDDESEV